VTYTKCLKIISGEENVAPVQQFEGLSVQYFRSSTSGLVHVVYVGCPVSSQKGTLHRPSGNSKISPWPHRDMIHLTAIG
jgi:hypothetical protein